MATTLKLEIVTPDTKVFSDNVDMVTLPGSEGEMGVYPNHMPLMTQLAAGEIIVRQGAEEFYLAVGDGFVAITGDRVSVLTDMAIKAENIDEARAEEALRAAEARLVENVSDEEIAQVHAALAQATAQLKVKRLRGK